MRGTTSIAAVLASLGMTLGAAAAEVPLVDMPTPCPCAADGACYPKRDTWGHYQSRWRRWPYDHRGTIPGRELDRAPGALPDELPPVVLPPKEEEDRRAPMSTSEREGRQPGPGADAAAEGAPAAELPPARPDARQPGAQPGVPAPGVPPVPNGGLEFDPPPDVPFGEPPAGGFEFGDEPEEEFQFPYRSPNDGLRFDSDLPPALPRGLQSQQGAANVAHHTPRPSGPPSEPSVVSRLPYVVPQSNGADSESRVARASAETATPQVAPRVGRAVFLMPADISR
jgi:hypothetical protein